MCQTLPTLNQAISDPPSFFRVLPLFADVEPEVLRILTPHTYYKNYKPEKELFEQDDDEHKLYLLMRGLITIERNASGISYYAPYRGAGAFIGVNSFIAEEKHAYAITTVTRCDLLKLKPSVFRQCYDLSPTLRRNVARFHRKHFYHTCDLMQEIMRLAFKENRIVTEFLEIADALAVQYLAEPMDETIVIDWLPRLTLADKIGCAGSTVYDVFSLLESKGFMRRATGGIILLKPEQVRMLRELYKHLHKLSIEDVLNPKPPKEKKPDNLVARRRT